MRVAVLLLGCCFGALQKKSSRKQQERTTGVISRRKKFRRIGLPLFYDKPRWLPAMNATKILLVSVDYFTIYEVESTESS